jgi:predicted nucleotidyltransferase
MAASPQGLTAREWDLVELPTGEILTVVGTYLGDTVRGRLTYQPDDKGTVEIFGRRYRKTSYEISDGIPNLRQVLALPGESHYLVPAHYIARHYPAVSLPTARPEVADLATTLSAAEIPVAVGGSWAVSSARAGSDYDLVIYGRSNIDRAAKIITGLAGYEPCLHFGLDFVRDKYRHFTRLSSDDLELLVADRRHTGRPRQGGTGLGEHPVAAVHPKVGTSVRGGGGPVPYRATG